MSSAALTLDPTSSGIPAARQTFSSGHPSKRAAHPTTLRAACASKLYVPQRARRPRRGLESIATRRPHRAASVYRALDTPRPYRPRHAVTGFLGQQVSPDTSADGAEEGGLSPK